MKFATPQMLWLFIILLPPLILFLWWSWRKRQQLITQFISSRLLAQLKVGVSPKRQKIRMALIVISVAFLILALARPQWGVTREEVRQRGLDIVIAIDTSNSMLAEDVSPNRLARAKLAALDLMHRAKTDRLGLVAFAGAAYLQCPLTLDDAAFSQSVNSLDTHSISQGGTALSEAIEEAQKAFKNESDNHRVLVLLTDGEDHDGEAVATAEKAAKAGMVIFTVGIGTPDGEKLRIRDEHGRLDYILDDQGHQVVSRLDEKLLQDIAQATKGFYLPLRGNATMDTLYERGIAPLPKSENSVKSFQRYHERFQYPLAIAIALLVLEQFLPDRSRRRSKNSATKLEASTKPAPVVATLSLLFIALSVSFSAWASPGSALREYNAGKYEESLKDYSKLLERKDDDPRLHFNAGAAAYQSKQLETATKEFNQALSSPDLQLQQRAYYNLGNTMYRLGQELPDDKKKESWENAIKGFESALKLNPQDADAKYNQQFVKQQLEELKKQEQQQQSKNDQNKDQKKDKQDQEKDQKNQPGSEDKKNQQQGDQSQSNKDDQANKSPSDEKSKDNQVKQKSDEEKQQEQQQEKEQNEQAQQGQKKGGDAQKKQAAQKQPSDQDKEKADAEAQQEAAMMAAGQMTPQQAKQLLDAQKGDEHVLQLAPPNKNTSRSRSFKNW